MAQLRESDIQFEVYGVGIDKALRSGRCASPHEDDDSAKAQQWRTCAVLRQLEEQIGQRFKFTPLDDAASQLDHLKKRGAQPPVAGTFASATS